MGPMFGWKSMEAQFPPNREGTVLTPKPGKELIFRILSGPVVGFGFGARAPPLVLWLLEVSSPASPRPLRL